MLSPRCPYFQEVYPELKSGFTWRLTMDAAPTQGFDRLAALESENATLRSRLLAREQTHAALQAEIAQCRERSQQWQEQIAAAKLNEAIAQEQEQATQQRAAELASSNQAMQRILALTAKSAGLGSLLGNVLQAIAEQFDAPIVEWWETLDEITVAKRLSYLHGQLLSGEDLLGHHGVPDFTIVPETLHLEPMTDRTKYVVIDDVEQLPYSPEEIVKIRDWYVQHGTRRFLNIPVIVDDRSMGGLVIFFPADRDFSESQVEFGFAMARYVGLAVVVSTQAEKAKQAAIAREQEIAAQERVAELAKANDIMRRTVNRLAMEPNLDGFLGFLLYEIASQLGADTAVITTYDSSTQQLRIAALFSDGKLDALDPMPPSLPQPHALFLERLLNTKGFCVFDVEEDADLFWPGAVEYLRIRGKRKSIGFAIRLDDQFFGQISLAYETTPNFNPEQTALVQALSTQAALAIQLTRLAEEAKQAAVAKLNEVIACEQEKAAQERVAQLARANTTLKKTLDVLAAEPDLDRTLGHILQVTSEQLGSFSSALWFYDPASDRFSLHLVYLEGEVIAATPETAHRLTGQWIYKRNLDRDLVLKQHVRDRVPVLYDLDDHPDITKGQRQYLNRLGVKAMLGIPLLLSAEIVGSFTIRFADRREFQAEELELAQALANQATLAIQLLRMANQKQQAAIVEERNRMARDIHDSLAQSLTGVVMQLNAATEFLTSQPQQAQTCITRAQNLAKQGLTEARRSVWLLYQGDLTASSLPDSLTRLIEQMTSSNGIAIILSIDGTPYDLDAPVSLNLLRIAQESLTNALRHANPQTIHLHLIYTPQQIQLRVQDDGCGLAPHPTTGRGFGLTGMNYRAKVIGAQLQIQSKLGEGTEILVTVPIASR